MHNRNSGPRYSAWAKSKFTNQRPFDPQHEEISRVVEKYYWKYESATSPFMRQMPLHKDFIMPVSIADIRLLLASLPTVFVDGLRAVFLLGGSKKQAKSWATFCYGRCGSCVIYLHPYPKSRMRRVYGRPLRPHIIHEHRRAGAHIAHTQNGFVIEFDKASLRRFYLRDVMMHEIGHHVDRDNFGIKRENRKESFAEWFATEYGYRLRC